jgi:hypothetical protein
MKVSLHVQGYADSDAEERMELAWGLEQDLRASDFDEIERPSVTAPPGARGSALEWAELVVTLAGSIPAFAAALSGWLKRNHGTAVAVEIGGDRLELAEASPEERRQLIELWLRRHGGECVSGGEEPASP